jgi:hypothetical protein
MKMRLFLFLFCCLSTDLLTAQLPEGVTEADSIAFARNIAQSETLPLIEELADWQVNAATQIYAQKTLRVLSQVNQEAVAALLDRDAAQAAYSIAKGDSLTTKESLSLLKEQLVQTQKRAKSAAAHRKNIAKLNANAEKAVDRPVKDQRKQLPKTYSALQQLNQSQQPNTETPEVTEKPTKRVRSKGKKSTSNTETPKVTEKPAKRTRVKQKKSETDPESEQTIEISSTEMASDSSDNKKNKPKKPKIKSPAQPKHARYAVEDDVLINPPAGTCAMAVERRDAFSGAIYREAVSTEIFRFTNEYMRKVLTEGQSHIICHAALANDGANGPMLFLTFYIRDASARRVFGGLPKQAKANLRFLNGQVIWLENTKNSDGELQSDQTTVVFKGQYLLEKSTLKQLATNELDQIRIAWGSGFEDYSIQQVHVLMEMAECLLK